MNNVIKMAPLYVMLEILAFLLATFGLNSEGSWLSTLCIVLAFLFFVLGLLVIWAAFMEDEGSLDTQTCGSQWLEDMEKSGLSTGAEYVDSELRRRLKEAKWTG